MEPSDRQIAALTSLLSSICVETISTVGLPDVTAEISQTQLTDIGMFGRTAGYALIHFAHPQIRGFIAVAGNPDIFRRTYPVPDANPNEIILQGWSMELANMVLGAFKARLASMGTLITMGVPVAVNEPFDLLLKPESAQLITITLRHGEGLLGVSLCATLDIRLALEVEPDESELIGRAGDAVLF